MSELLTSAQMKALEKAAIESGEVTGLELMERAGQGVVAAVLEVWPELAGDVSKAGDEGGSAPRPADSPRDNSGQKKRRAVVFCGPGNNGGDGFVVARLLAARNWRVKVYLLGDPEGLPPDAKANYDDWLKLGDVSPWVSDRIAAVEADLLVDAVFGAGLTRAVSQEVLTPLVALARSCDRVVAVDAPTGLCMDSGRALGAQAGLEVDLTVTFHRPRVGQYLAEGPRACAALKVIDIGLRQGADPRVALAVQPPRGTLAKASDAHKYGHGHALVLSGGAGQTGAARLAARGALRIGAGLVTLGVPHEAQAEVAAQITAVMMREIGDDGALRLAMADARLNALCLGPGLGLERARELVPVALEARRKTVLDADALTAFADLPDRLFSLLHADCVLTPHAGEFARLFPHLAERLTARTKIGPAFSKVDATRDAAQIAGCVVLLKGADTVIAAPDGQCVVCSAAYERQAQWLATAGSGDVLAGFIAGLMARGFAPFAAAEMAAWLHVECARTFGPGLIAEDLPETLPKVFAALGA